MEFVYLKRIQTEHGERLIPHAVNDEIALLKARTLLYILAENQVLAMNVANEHVIYYPKTKPAMSSLLTPNMATSMDDLQAIIPVIPFKQVWDQPGMAYVFGGLENQTLFSNYLMSSKRWLDNHPGSQASIESKIMEAAP